MTTTYVIPDVADQPDNAVTMTGPNPGDVAFVIRGDASHEYYERAGWSEADDWTAPQEEEE